MGEMLRERVADCLVGEAVDGIRQTIHPGCGE